MMELIFPGGKVFCWVISDFVYGLGCQRFLLAEGHSQGKTIEVCGYYTKIIMFMSLAQLNGK